MAGSNGSAAGSFVHLHLHTEYSMLDGASRVDDVVRAAAEDGQPAAAITDHGVLYGVVDFYKACERHGIKPIIGFEAYQSPTHRRDRPPRRGRLDDAGGESEGGGKLYHHLTLLAEDDVGYSNLVKLSSLAFLEGYYYKPRLDWELLERHSKGVIATTGCLSGIVPAALLRGDERAALEAAGRLRDIFGRENLFVEVQDHAIPAQKRILPALVSVARDLGLPLLATNDSHYTRREDAKTHDALLCVQTGSLMSDPNRFRFHGDQHYLKTAAEMRRLFEEIPQACDNTLLVAERCNVTLDLGGSPKLPVFPVPDGFESDVEYLRHLTFRGARERWGDPLPEEVVRRLDYELGVIADMGFASYFLIVWDLVRYARDNGIRVGPGRGSAAGCAVAYCLRITDLDPVRYGLLFERFLNPSRVSMPDIDMDFDSRRRDELIRYAAEKYGRDHVAQIITFSTIKARAAVRDAARVLGKPYALGDRIAKAMPPLIMGRDTPLDACLEYREEHADGYRMAADLRKIYEEDPEAREVIDVARGLEGLRRQDSIHAAGVVITPRPLMEYLPIQRKPEAGEDPESAPIVTQFELGAVEALGLLKMDFLGLRNLDVIEDTLELIRRTRGEDVDIDSIPLDDEKTFELLKRGDTIGVFQLEGGPMRSLIRSLVPTRFEDIAALVALYRPGPMGANMHHQYADRKNGREPVTYEHPDLEEILADTYGLMIYQESVMQVAQRIAGYSLAEADNLRKACGKKIRELIAAEREKFIEGCERQGYGRELGQRLFDIIEPFADYAFNKSHAFGYGLIAYQTAYLKANYPAEYMAALLTSVKNNLDKAAVYLSECRRLGIDVRVPDVNTSESDFTVVYDEEGKVSIPFGLSAVRNVGEGVVQRIVQERERAGPFRDFYDFCERVDESVLSKRVLESLIKAGAFDSLGHPRGGLLEVYEQVVDQALERRRREAEGQFDLFSTDEAATEEFTRIPIPDRELPKRDRISYEKEMLGLYVSDHPLLGNEAVVARHADVSISELLETQTEERRVIAGVATNVRKKWTRKGELMGTFQLEDLQSSVEVMVFPKTMASHGELLEEDRVVKVEGRLDLREEPPKFIASAITVLDLSDGTRPLLLEIPLSRLTDDDLARLREVIEAHPGDVEVRLSVGGIVVALPPAWRVDLTKGLVPELRELFGVDSLRL
ncbi:MAG: DNA polymerase III subunit alpha [Acidimicrobiales bacterium]|nr:MAG: DNA polymerase III subunit alpha [Acidimicrobiales bacterium]